MKARSIGLKVISSKLYSFDPLYFFGVKNLKPIRNLCTYFCGTQFQFSKDSYSYSK